MQCEKTDQNVRFPHSLGNASRALKIGGAKISYHPLPPLLPVYKAYYCLGECAAKIAWPTVLSFFLRLLHPYQMCRATRNVVKCLCYL